MDFNEVAATGIGAIITATGGVIALLVRSIYRARSKGQLQSDESRRQDESLAGRQYTALLNRYERRITRLETQVEQQFTAMQELSDEHATCRAELAGIYSELVAVHDTACRHAQALAVLGHDPGPVPAIRSRPEIPTRGEFLARQAEQSDRLNRKVQEAEKRIEP